MNTRLAVAILAILIPVSAGAAELRGGMARPWKKRRAPAGIAAGQPASRFLDGAANDLRANRETDNDAMADPLWPGAEDMDSDGLETLAQRERGPMHGRGDRPFPPFGGPGGRRRPGRPPGPGPMVSPELMEKLRNLPPEEQEKVLRNNERFQELPKRMQDEMIDRLRRFQALPQAQRDMIQKRFDAFSKMTPEERQKMRDFYAERWQKMPDNRRRALLGEFRRLRMMPPEEREKYLASPEVAKRFNTEDLDTLKRLGEFAPPPPPPGMMPPPPPERHHEELEPQP